MSYWQFIRRDWPLISFGFLAAFMMGPGQTFFIGIFRDSLAGAYDLSLGEFGHFYSGVSLASAAVFLWSGKLIDQWPLQRVTVVYVSVFALSALLLAGSFHLSVMVLGLFGVRHLGQGLMGHVSSTTMARYFVSNRAKAISLAALGFAVSEAIVPILAVSLLAFVGWRLSWLLVGVIVLGAGLPLALWFLKSTQRDLRLEREPDPAPEGQEAPVPASRGHDFTRAEVLRDWRFWCIIPAHISSSYFLTGVFLNQASLAGELGISMQAIALCFTGFAVANMMGTLLIGPIVDRFGYLLTYPICYLGYVGSVFFLTGANGFWGGMLFYSCVGFSLGLAMPAAGSLWPGLYGVRHLGAIRSMIVAFFVLSTGLAPASFGYLIDRGWEVREIALYGAVYACAALGLLLVFTAAQFRKEKAPAV
ncbi:MAG: MFS transporter [Alphaproteobacteria bacterium]|nr:MAG: MFS transporter [Alphaproteobacteria bacterium]